MESGLQWHTFSEEAAVQAPKAFQTFCRQMHQDVFQIHGENVVDACVAGLTREERAELKPYVEWLLRTKTNAELKGVLQRAKTDFFFTSKSARALLDDLVDRLA